MACSLILFRGRRRWVLSVLWPVVEVLVLWRAWPAESLPAALWAGALVPAVMVRFALASPRRAWPALTAIALVSVLLMAYCYEFGTGPFAGLSDASFALLFSLGPLSATLYLWAAVHLAGPSVTTGHVSGGSGLGGLRTPA